MKDRPHIKLFIILSILLIPLISFAYENEPDGFRGIKWGTDIFDLKNMSRRAADPDGMAVYEKKNDKLQIGDAILKRIGYVFWKNKFYSVMVNSKGSSNWRDLRQATFVKFGEGFKDNQYIEKYVWFGTTTDVLLDYNEFNEEGTLTFYSIEIGKQYDEYKKQKAKEGAEKGF